MMQVSRLKSFDGLRAFNAFHTLMLGLKMLPAYRAESYEDFFARVEMMPKETQEKIVREAALFVPLEKDELSSMISFCKDKNGVHYGPENMKNLTPPEMVECIVAVSMSILSWKEDLASEAEKKN